MREKKEGRARLFPKATASTKREKKGRGKKKRAMRAVRITKERGGSLGPKRKGKKTFPFHSGGRKGHSLKAERREKKEKARTFPGGERKEKRVRPFGGTWEKNSGGEKKRPVVFTSRGGEKGPSKPPPKEQPKAQARQKKRRMFFPSERGGRGDHLALTAFVTRRQGKSASVPEREKKTSCCRHGRGITGGEKKKSLWKSALQEGVGLRKPTKAHFRGREKGKKGLIPLLDKEGWVDRLLFPMSEEPRSRKKKRSLILTLLSLGGMALGVILASLEKPKDPVHRLGGGGERAHTCPPCDGESKKNPQQLLPSTLHIHVGGRKGEHHVFVQPEAGGGVDLGLVEDTKKAPRTGREKRRLHHF